VQEGLKQTRGAGAWMGVPFEFLNAKLRGRRPEVYEGDRLRELSACQSVEELSRRLFPREEPAGRLALERRLRQRCLNELCSFLHYLSPEAGQFYLSVLRRFQVDNIVVLLRLFAGRQGDAEVERYLTDLPPELTVPSGELMRSEDLAAFLKLLPAEFARCAEPTLPLYRRYETVAFTEMAIERRYWEGIREGLQIVPVQWRGDCARPLVHEMASSRLLTVLRAARNYNLQWEELRPLLPPHPGESALVGTARLSERALRELFEEPSARRVARMVRSVSEDEAADLVGLEEKLWAETYSLANHVYYSCTEGPAIVVGYYYVRRNELKGLTALVESLHYGEQPTGAS